ncbi:MAG: 2-oxoglutarate dehydrogenase [Clostridia bacterium]|nr:2-oxoglutarate dehydrogenase [Clostridia bacterium]
MFGRRADGRKVKKAPLLYRVVPHIMETRNDSEVYFAQDLPLKGMDDYINKKAEEGIKISYMHIIYAAIIRTIALKPELNRFIVNCIPYQRKDIWLSLMIKKSLSEDGEETLVKLKFDGTETLLEIKEKLENAVAENKDEANENSTASFVKKLEKTPNIILKIIIKFLKFLDRYGLLPKSIIELSPFHTSAFLTNVGSLGIDAIFHHIYNFGTTSLFFAMGKKKKDYIPEDDELIEEKCLSFAFVGDERICDGYYFASSFKQLIKFIKKPELMEEKLILEDNKEEVQA